MEINEANLNELLGHLQKTLSPDGATRKSAEKCLESIEAKQNYPLLLLNLVDKDSIDMTLRVAAAVTFKNYVKRNWKVDEDATDKIHTSDRTTIKQFIINLMLKAPESIQRQLSDAVSIIGREDFPAKWPHLIQEMVEKFGTGDFHIINGVLQTAHSIFKRYRYEFKSQELWTEIKLVLDSFAKPLTELFINTVNLAAQHANNAVAIKIITSSLTLICKIFYSLNFQDLPEHFEDNMKTWMENFLALLTADNPLLRSDSDEEAGLGEQLKSQICDNICLYASNYDEEFRPYLPQFVTAVWNLLVTTGKEVKYDALVSNAIGFLSSVAERPHYAELFADPNILNSICEKVILPNMEFRSSDEELFEDNPEEYIRRDIEGSDVDTRRRAACDLVKALSKSFEAQMTDVFSRYVAAMLASYSTSPESNWRAKDAAVYLIIALASKGATQKHGTTKTNQLVDLVDFFRTHIITEIQQGQVDRLMVLKADAIKYLMTFRNHLPREALLATLKHLVDLLRSPSLVVHSYAANALDKLLILKSPDGTGALIKASDLAGLEQPLLVNLFYAMTLPGSEENEYLMKAIMRAFSTLQEAVLPYLGETLGGLNHKLMLVSRNPSKPHFNHYLFETLSLSVRIGCKANKAAVSSFEDGFFPSFQEILLQDVQEFVPYVFQILSLMLELRGGEGTVPEPYMALFPHLLVPVLWERPANIHPLVRLLQAFIQIGRQQVAFKLEALLGIFQKLVASKSNDHEGFYLLQSMIEFLPKEALQPFMNKLFVLLFQRLHSSKTTKYVKSLLVFFFLFAIQYGTAELIAVIEGVQANLFSMVLNRLVIPEVQRVSGNLERKICAVGLTRLICDTPACFTGPYSDQWAAVLGVLVGLFELPEDGSVPEDEHFVEIEDTPGYQSAFSQLIFVGKKERDPVSDIKDPRAYLVQSLHRLSVQHPGMVGQQISAKLPPQAQTYVQQYLQAANLTLA